MNIGMVLVVIWLLYLYHKGEPTRLKEKFEEFQMDIIFKDKMPEIKDKGLLSLDGIHIDQAWRKHFKSNSDLVTTIRDEFDLNRAINQVMTERNDIRDMIESYNRKIEEVE